MNKQLQKKKLQKQHRKEVRAEREKEKHPQQPAYPKCPVCTSHNIREISMHKVECATCHTTFNQ